MLMMEKSNIQEGVVNIFFSALGAAAKIPLHKDKFKYVLLV